MKTFIGVIAVMILLSMLGFQYEPKGIIALNGYGEAVAFCEGGKDIPRHKGWGYEQYRKDGILMVVNDGYYNDPRNDDLFNLAKVECAPYLNK